MYRTFFGLSEKPFNLTPDPDFLYLSQSHKEALAHLTYGVESKSGFVLVTGDVGAGKTTLLRKLIRNLGDDVLLSQVTNTRVSYKELLEMVLRDFGLQPGTLGKTALLAMLNEFLIEKYREGKNCVLLIDEAQNLGVSSLEGVRMLSNLETEKAKLLHTILVGQPGLRDLIDSPELEQLRQRITVRYHLGPLSVGEVGEYVRFRLDKVIQDPEKAPVFPDEVVPRIHDATGGLPRLINVLCDAALLHAYVGDSRVITEALVAGAAEQVAKDQKGRDVEAEPELDAEGARLREKLAEIEGRLNSVVADVARGVSSGGSPQRFSERATQLAGKEKALSDLEEGLKERLAEMKRREAELTERVTTVKAEWKKRMEQLERSRRQLLAGGARQFPALRVHAHDPDPRIQNALKEALDAAGAGAEVHTDYEAFREALRESSRSGGFTVAVLGAVQDDALNVERVASLSAELPQVPRVYLSDLDLSTLRRRILGAGANYFLEKPQDKSGAFAVHREKMENLKTDLRRVLDSIYRQYKAFFESFLPSVGS